jgi:pimeloyl-ACP methyl ester carboxylesterase
MDFASCGKSEGQYVSLSFYEKHDVVTLIEFLKERKFFQHFALWGRSMGAATALMTTTLTSDVLGVVSDSSFVTIGRICQEFASRKYFIPSCLTALLFCCCCVQSKIK